MTPEDLGIYAAAVRERHALMMGLVENLDPAPSDAESEDYHSDALAEAMFLRHFTAYEQDVERLFLHYVTGGASLQGTQANTFLRISDESHARQLTKGGSPFLSWAKPANIRNTAKTYIENGWPLVDMMSANEQVLSDCERVRNRIAHASPEAVQQFNIAQRNLLGTERIFSITPGQFLRIRSTRYRKLHIAHYAETINTTLEALLDPLT